MSIKKAHLHFVEFHSNQKSFDLIEIEAFDFALFRAIRQWQFTSFRLNVSSFFYFYFVSFIVLNLRWICAVELFFLQLISIAPQQWEIKQLLASFLTSHPRQWTFKFMKIIGLKCRVQGEKRWMLLLMRKGEAFCKNLLN